MSSPAPPSVRLGTRDAVPVDVVATTASLSFDVATRVANATARVRFVMEDCGGHPVLDLRQDVDWLRLDGRSLTAHAWPHVDLGAGEAARVRVLDVRLEQGGHHELEVGYCLRTPAATGAAPLDWTSQGIRFDLWMSDLEPGRYLEMWVPAPLCHDRFALEVNLEVTGTDRPHLVVSNATVEAVNDLSWRLRFPDRCTSLSPMLVLAPADEIEVRQTTCALAGRRAPLRVVTARPLGVDADLAAAEEDTVAWLTYLACRYGPWAHGETFTGFIWASARGMEYDGATTATVGALEHEVFHSWFGRGVKPARAADGWIDEAWTTWATLSRPGDMGRFAVSELGLEDEPVVLYPPHPWSRHTPVAAYTSGTRLFSGLAGLLGGADRLRSAMADWYRAHAGGLVTTDGLETHLRSWSGVDIGPWWSRYVHGRG